MVSSLSAAAQQVGQPHWGNSGPHDAGMYCQWPHQTGFFHHQGSWYSEYGRFFLQWYSSLLLQHADHVLARARRVFEQTGVRLHAQLPTIHWWYNQAAHAVSRAVGGVCTVSEAACSVSGAACVLQAPTCSWCLCWRAVLAVHGHATHLRMCPQRVQAELTAGHYNTSSRNGYLAFCQVLARHKAGLVLTGAEMRDCEQPSYALASPESLLLQLRATAASQHVPVTLSNLSTRFDADALAEFERKSFDAASYRGIDLAHVTALSFGNMGDAMFEPQNWLSFKDWAARLRQHNEQLRHPPRRTAGSAAQRQQQQQAAAAAAAQLQSAVLHEAQAAAMAEEREGAVV